MRRKLNAMALEFVDKNVLIVDGVFCPAGLLSMFICVCRFNCAGNHFEGDRADG